MQIRENLEREEERLLSPFARLSSAARRSHSSGSPCPLRTAFMLDRDHILQTPSFRALSTRPHGIWLHGHPERSRLDFTMEAARLSRTCAKKLKLNEDLAEAVALSHEIGKPAFGCCGEEAMAAIAESGFHHASQSLRILDNALDENPLSHDTRDGILHHGWARFDYKNSQRPACLEAQLAGFICDWLEVSLLADDVKKGGLQIDHEQNGLMLIPAGNASEKTGFLIDSLIEASINSGEIRLKSGHLEAAQLFSRTFNEAFARHPSTQEFISRCRRAFWTLYLHWIEKPASAEIYTGGNYEEWETERRIIDALASLSEEVLLSESAPLTGS